MVIRDELKTYSGLQTHFEVPPLMAVGIVSNSKVLYKLCILSSKIFTHLHKGLVGQLSGKHNDLA